MSNDNALGDELLGQSTLYRTREKVSLTEFKIVSADFADDDSLNFPSPCYQYTIRRPEEMEGMEAD